MMYRNNLDIINASIEAQEELNRIAHQKALVRKKASEDARDQRMAEIEAKKAATAQATGAVIKQ